MNPEPNHPPVTPSRPDSGLGENGDLVSRRKPWWILPVVGLVFSLSAVGVLASGTWRASEVLKQVNLSVSRQPARFTELYFTDPETIPKQLSLSKPNEVGFTVANHEHRAMDYPYVVTAESAQGRTVIAQGQVGVASGKLAHTTAQFTPPQPNTKYLLAVHLIGRAEVIRFFGTS